jgi:N-carbamoylputrescine amidase
MKSDSSVSRNGDGVLRVAMLHLDFVGGCQGRNLDKLTSAVEKAAAGGADWVITPEVAVQGYFFGGTPENIVAPSDDRLRPVTELAARHGLVVLLGCAERDALSGAAHNSCLVIGPEGAVLGCHRKTKSIGPAEAWSVPGTEIVPIACPDLNAGVLICADSWVPENAVTLRDLGADVVIVPAAWPPGQHGPGDCWERGSAASGLPFWVCNQTGFHERLDFRAAVSAVLVDGAVKLSHQGPSDSLLLFDWDLERGDTRSDAFDRVPM